MSPPEQAPVALVDAAGSTSGSKGQRTRARILEAAIEHFARDGHRGASVPEIARSVGVSHSTLYQHFGRKEDLLRAAVDADLTALLDEVTGVLDDLPGGDTAERLVSVLPRLALGTSTHPLARRVLAELTDEDVRSLDDLPALVALRNRVFEVLRHGQRGGDIRPDLDAQQTADGLITITLALLSAVVRLDDSVDEIPRASSTLGFLTDALRAPPVSGRRRR